MRKNDVYGFILYVGLTTENEMRVTMSVEKHRLISNRQNLNKLNNQMECVKDVEKHRLISNRQNLNKLNDQMECVKDVEKNNS